MPDWLDRNARGHAEVAGAGLVGLTAATLLARVGWSVRVHERAADLRETGAGLFLWRNALAVLADTGALQAVSADTEQLTSWERFDERGRRIFHRTIPSTGAVTGSSSGPVIVRRSDLHRALVDAARGAGVEVLTGSEVLGADAGGALRLADGTGHCADLVIGADGVGSPVRRSLGLTGGFTALGSGGARFLVARTPEEMQGRAYEYKHCHRSVGVVPCGETVYVYLESRADDNAARRIPLDDDAWLRDFPGLESVFGRLPGPPQWSEFVRVRCRRWSAGRAVLLGDAAHAMPPHLSQGACLGMANARSLVGALEQIREVPAALRAWEEAERSVTDLTQRWATGYARIGARWPRPLLGLRSPVLRAADRSRYVRSQTGRAARYESPFVAAGGDPARTD